MEETQENSTCLKDFNTKYKMLDMCPSKMTHDSISFKESRDMGFFKMNSSDKFETLNSTYLLNKKQKVSIPLLNITNQINTTTKNTEKRGKKNQEFHFFHGN